jgi:BirA family biotin operon repressor/biotin-[acetyl-CoA-carboxylase] ligase
VDKTELAVYLQDLPMGEIRWYDQLPSTNASALDWLHQFPHEYSLIATDRQTAGYGRNRRTWYSTPGASLTFSFILYLSQGELDALPLFSALTALAVCDAITSFSPLLKTSVKWPNDILLDRKKVAGILPEAAWQGSSCLGLVIGIGVNVLAAAVPPGEELLFPATCLEEGVGQAPDRWDLLRRILQAFISRRKTFPSSIFLDDWRKKLAFLGEEVAISSNDQEPRLGIFEGVDERGYLLLKEKNGRIATFPLGDVSLRPHAL